MNEATIECDRGTGPSLVDAMFRLIDESRSREHPPEPRFARGQLVRHVRYGYRGVVVAVDLRCKAPPEWYYANKTQPRRDQPWYHVLVDAASRVTYTAESSLEEDETGHTVSHPLIDTYFAAFKAGRYVRNATPWPGWP